MIVFVRHGESGHNAEGRLGGRIETELTERGRAQVRAVADTVASFEPARVVASPSIRTRDTGAAIAAAIGRSLATDDRLVELDYGEWDGRRIDEVTSDEWRRWRGDPSFAPPGGESLEDVRARVVGFAREELDAGETVVAVSHVSPIKAAVAWALGVSDAVAFRMRLDLASITRLDVGPQLVSFNETAHLVR